MSIGIRLHDAASGTLEQRAAAVKAQGFSCVHLALSKTLSPDLMAPAAATSGLAHEVRRALDGLDIAVLGCYLTLAQQDDAQAAQDQSLRHRGGSRLLCTDIFGADKKRDRCGYW